MIRFRSAILNCTNNYCINQTEGDNCFSLGYTYYYKNIYYENCPIGTYNDNYNCINCDEKCFSCSKDSSEQELCLSCNKSGNYYEKYNNELNPDSSFIDCFKSPKGFYLDSSDLLYKHCYNSCESCNTFGNEENHNCIECNETYKYELKLNDYFNCYFKCPHYFYIEENNDNI